MDPARHAPRCELAVLVGAKYDEATLSLEDSLWDVEKPLVVWPSPGLENAGELAQRGFFQDLLRRESGRKTLLGAAIKSEKLKQEVFALLGPTGRSSFYRPEASHRVY